MKNFITNDQRDEAIGLAQREAQQAVGIARASEASVSNFNKRLGEWEQQAKRLEARERAIMPSEVVTATATAARDAVRFLGDKVTTLGVETDKRFGDVHMLSVGTEGRVDTMACRLKNLGDAFQLHLELHLDKMSGLNPVIQDDPGDDDSEEDNELLLVELLRRCETVLNVVDLRPAYEVLEYRGLRTALRETLQGYEL